VATLHALEKRAEDAWSGPSTQEALVAALADAKAAYATRRQRQGEDWWETIDARDHVRALEVVLRLTSSQREALWEVWRTAYAEPTPPMDAQAGIDRLQSVLVMERQVFGSSHREVALTLSQMALRLHRLNRAPEAESLAREALAIRREVQGPRHPDTASSVHNLARALGALGRYAEAEPLDREVLAIRREVLGPRHPDTAKSMHNLAHTLGYLGRFREAEGLTREALVIRRDVLGPKHSETASSVATLAAILHSLGRFAEAEQLSREALAIARDVLGPRHPETASTLNNLAATLGELGRAAEAESLERDALALRREVLGTRHPDTASSLRQLAGTLHEGGRYEEAEPLMREALAISREVQGPRHPDTATCLNALAVTLVGLGRPAEAEALEREALAIRREVLGTRHPATAESLLNFASRLKDLGRSDEAESSVREALAIYRDVLGPGHPNSIRSLSQLGLLLEEFARPQEAADSYLEALRASQRGLTGQLPLFAATSQRGFLDQRVVHEDNLLGLALRAHGTSAEAALEGAWLSKHLLAEAGRQESGALQASLGTAGPDVRARWDALQASKQEYATAVVTSLRDASSTGRPSVSPVALLAMAERIHTLEVALRRDWPAYAHAAQVQAPPTVAQVQAALRPDEALLEYVWYAPLDVQTRKWQAFQYGAFVVRGDGGPVHGIPLGDAAAIEAAVTAFRAEVVADLARVQQVYPTPTEWRRMEQATRARAAAVHALMWAPLAAALTGMRRVYVAPDGLLELLPFEALATRDVGRWRYLLETIEIVYVNTGRDLARLNQTQSEARQAGRAVVVGNPAFGATPAQLAAALPAAAPGRPTVGSGTPASTSLPPAPGAAVRTLGGSQLRPEDYLQEPALTQLANVVARQLRARGVPVTLLIGAQASEAGVGAAITGPPDAPTPPWLVSLATHGLWLTPETSVNPLLRSLLLLAGFNHAPAADAASDGVLTAYEVSGLNLQGTALVNLTACETGVGEVTADGVAGLRQAFVFAGARAVTLSLFEVPVAEGTAQTEAFFRRWLRPAPAARTPPYVAFRAAQLGALAAARTTHGVAHPMFWAAMVFAGDPGDLPH
jgi:tetratricopeptide (TPR) repeat protein/CHAT domain-containing protein